MGRSPFFTINQIYQPPVEQSDENLKIIQTLSTLVEGQRVRFTCVPVYYGLTRTISVYEYTPSNISHDIVYDVVSTNFEPALADINLTAIALKDPAIISSQHIIGWVLTTDGYIRETEGYGIKYKLNSIEIVE